MINVTANKVHIVHIHIQHMLQICYYCNIGKCWKAYKLSLLTSLSLQHLIKSDDVIQALQKKKKILAAISSKIINDTVNWGASGQSSDF